MNLIFYKNFISNIFNKMLILILLGSYTCANSLYIKEKILPKENYQLDENFFPHLST